MASASVIASVWHQAQASFRCILSICGCSAWTHSRHDMRHKTNEPSPGGGTATKKVPDTRAAQAAIRSALVTLSRPQAHRGLPCSGLASKCLASPGEP